jgi:hypothetical protein
MNPAENPSRGTVTEQIGSVQLPSGKVVPVYQSCPARHTQDLSYCDACNSHLMQPIDEENTGDEYLFQSIRQCPNCGTIASAIASYADMEFYDDQLDEGSHVLIEALEAISGLPVYTGYRP